MKNKKGYYIDFDKSGKVDAIFAIFDESELVKVLSFCEKKFLPHALNQTKVYKFLDKCVFVNEKLFQYFKKRYLDNDVSKTAQSDKYYLTLGEDGSVFNVYKKDSIGNGFILSNDGIWESVTIYTGGYLLSFAIDYETYKFIVNECFVYSPEYILKNLKYMGRGILESDFKNKDFKDALFSNAHNYPILPQSVRTKYPTVNHIKDFLFPKKETDPYIPPTSMPFKIPYIGMDFGYSDSINAMTWAVYNTTPNMLQGHWVEEFTPRGGLGSRLHKESQIEDLKPSFISLLKDLSFKNTTVVKSEIKTKYKISYVSRNSISEETISKIGYSNLEPKIVSEKLIEAITKGKHLLVRNENDELIAFYNKETVLRMSFTIFN